MQESWKYNMWERERQRRAPSFNPFVGRSFLIAQQAALDAYQAMMPCTLPYRGA